MTGSGAEFWTRRSPGPVPAALRPSPEKVSSTPGSSSLFGWLFFLGIMLILSSCATVDRRHQVIVSIPEQRMALLEDGAPIAT